ncbi:hypothetical protein Tco_0788676 [Tanacetum coccineum]
MIEGTKKQFVLLLMIISAVCKLVLQETLICQFMLVLLSLRVNAASLYLLLLLDLNQGEEDLQRRCATYRSLVELHGYKGNLIKGKFVSFREMITSQLQGKLWLYDEVLSDKFKTGLGYNATTAVESFVDSSEMLENQEYNRSKGYHAVPLPYTGNYIPRKPDLTFIDEIVESENMDVTTVITPSDFEKDMSNNEFAGVKNNGDAVKPKIVRENNFIPLIIEDWNFDDESR